MGLIPPTEGAALRSPNTHSIRIALNDSARSVAGRAGRAGGQPGTAQPPRAGKTAGGPAR